MAAEKFIIYKEVDGQSYKQIHDVVKDDITNFVEGDYVHTTGDEQIAGNKTFNNNVVIEGNLAVQGTTTAIETVDLVITDNVIVLNKDETGAGVTLGTAGIEIERGTEANAQLLFNEASDRFEAGLVGDLSNIVLQKDFTDTNSIDITVGVDNSVKADLRKQDTSSITLAIDANGLKADLVKQTSNTVTLSVDGSGLKADLKYEDSQSIDLSDSATGLKADLIKQNTNSIDLTVDASGLKADLKTQNSTTVTLSVDASGLKAEVNLDSIVEVVAYETTEDVIAGDMVNIYDVGSGVYKIRKAIATSLNTGAHGYVKTAALTGATVNVYFDGLVDIAAGGLIPGRKYYLSKDTAGKVVSSAPNPTTIIQTIGRAVSPTKLVFEPDDATWSAA